MDQIIRKPNNYWLSELPQRGSVAKQAFGVDWWEFDQIFKFYLGQFIVVTGTAGSGKSTFMLNLLLRLARLLGVKSFLYVPENEAYLREKLRLIWGDDDTFNYFASRQCRVQSAVPAFVDEPAHTLHWILDQAADAVQQEKLEVVMIDPWNELDHAKPRDMLMSDYIGECLLLVKQFCRSLNAIVIIVAHPTKAVNEGGGRIPTLADIEGSMNWFNNCDNGLIVVRDTVRDSTRVISAKVREIGAGKRGVCHFDVDPQTGIFKPQYGAVSL
jgi:twinkle protein